MSFLYIFHNFKDFKQNVLGNIAEYYNLPYETLDDFAEAFFRAYVDEMENLSRHKLNPLKLSIGWIDFDNKRFYYFVDGHMHFRNY